MKTNSLINSQLICSDYNKSYPMLISGKGIYLYDDSGKEYIDGSGCTAVVTSLGHGNEEIANALYEQTKKLSVHPTHLFHSEVVENYLKDLCDFAPDGFNKAWTISGGTEAIENTVKLAFQYHKSKNQKRTKVLARWGSYHGNSISVLDYGGMKARRVFYEDLMVNHPHVEACNPYRKPEDLTLQEYEDKLVFDFEKTVNQFKDDIICFIAEPIVGAALGAMEPTENYFSRISNICKEHDILLVADEVMTGFGRTGRNFGCEHFGTHADIIACAKGISSGYFPLGAIIAHDKVTSALNKSGDPFFSGQTYSCIPQAAAVGHKVLEIINRDRVVENSNAIGEYLKNGFMKIKEKSCIGDVRGRGLFLGLEFVKDKNTKEPFEATLNFSKTLEKYCLEEGLVTYGGRGTINYTGGDHMLFAPPLIMNKDQCDEVLSKFEKALFRLQEHVKF